MRLLLLPLIAAFVAIACSSSDSTPATTTTVPAHLYKENVYPIFQESCALTACHGSTEAAPPLGVKISATDPEETYTDLVNKPSTRFVGTNLVEPGDPNNSLVMRKMDGTQNQLASCPAGNCGKSMPPPDDSDPTSTTQLLSQKKRDTVRAWIQDGAKDD